MAQLIDPWIHTAWSHRNGCTWFSYVSLISHVFPSILNLFTYIKPVFSLYMMKNLSAPVGPTLKIGLFTHTFHPLSFNFSPSPALFKLAKKPQQHAAAFPL
jgi:hypothetical protein